MIGADASHSRNRRQASSNDFTQQL